MKIQSMIRWVVLLAACAGPAVADTGLAAPENTRFVATLATSGHVLSKDDGPRGKATLWQHRDGSSVGYRVQVKRLKQAAELRICVGAPGEAGTVVATLTARSPSARGLVSSMRGEGVLRAADLAEALGAERTRALLAACAAGRVYLSVVTPVPGGQAVDSEGAGARAELRAHFAAAERELDDDDAAQATAAVDLPNQFH